MALTNFKKEEIPSGKSDLLCSVDGCSAIWTVRIDGQLPKCSFHQWQQPVFGRTKTWKQHLEDKSAVKTVSAWYDEAGTK